MEGVKATMRKTDKRDVEKGTNQNRILEREEAVCLCGINGSATAGELELRQGQAKYDVKLLM